MKREPAIALVTACAGLIPLLALRMDTWSNHMAETICGGLICAAATALGFKSWKYPLAKVAVLVGGAGLAVAVLVMSAFAWLMLSTEEGTQQAPPIIVETVEELHSRPEEPEAQAPPPMSGGCTRSTPFDGPC
jgi:hypothetical protein